MPLIVLADVHKQHLKFLTTVDAEVVGEFANIAISFLRKGANVKIFQTAAKKLEVSPDTVQHSVEGLMYLMTECAKFKVSDLDFHDSILTLGFAPELNKQLLDLYLEQRDEIRSLLGELALKLPAYHDLQWRLDVQVASRSLRQQMEPKVILRLDTEDTAPHTHLLQTDAATLGHLLSELDGALKSIKSSHYRRITRSIK